MNDLEQLLASWCIALGAIALGLLDHWDGAAVIRSPRHQPQLGRGPTASKDCGPRAVQMGLDQISRGQLIPSIPDIRQRMGKAGNQTTNTSDAERAVESWDDEMVAFKRKPLRYERRQGEAWLRLLDDALKGGAYAHLAIDYGVFNDRCKAHGVRTGDPRFRGGHSVGIMGWKRDEKGTVFWRLWDPLDDARRPRVIPKGPRWVRRSILVAAWKAFGGYFGIFRGGERIA